jgi:peptidoglycan/xylan/chitin deacetylase (PgdA/CDA1 family)
MRNNSSSKAKESNITQAKRAEKRIEEEGRKESVKARIVWRFFDTGPKNANVPHTLKLVSCQWPAWSFFLS